MLDTDSAIRLADVARREAETTIHRVLIEAFGSQAVVRRPISPELDIPVPMPADWDQGITVARGLRNAAEGRIREYALKARGAGVSWKALAAPLGIEADDLAGAAFDAIAGQVQRFDRRYTSWRCTTCGELVTDYGPDNMHPVDCETGHHEDCARHRSEITAYETDQEW